MILNFDKSIKKVSILKTTSGDKFLEIRMENDINLSILVTIDELEALYEVLDDYLFCKLRNNQ